MFANCVCALLSANQTLRKLDCQEHLSITGQKFDTVVTQVLPMQCCSWLGEKIASCDHDVPHDPGDLCWFCMSIEHLMLAWHIKLAGDCSNFVHQAHQLQSC